MLFKYFGRAGRTARYNAHGESLLMLLPSEEEGMLRQLAIHKIPIEEIKVLLLLKNIEAILIKRREREREGGTMSCLLH